MSMRRELEGLFEGLRLFAPQLQGQTIVAYGDNQSAVHNLKIGYSTPELQAVCVQIFRLCAEWSIALTPRWLRRCHLQEEDDGSKLMNTCDFLFSPATLAWIDKTLGGRSHSHDRFASAHNRREGMASNALFYTPEPKQLTRSRSIEARIQKIGSILCDGTLAT